ncbi:iron-containing alcohol dehydrogenase [Clostridium sp. SHJSY1]|uniref:iron-containing alcohol dehydrogenase n=1 Tax=Clostridium sp. SHJSY1 TaxID=2942483 RepID=UPI0028757B2F|nr:iron-containing alcohol dehydrogenase [Clostridium sp. SHJSY1]MDS0525017.1 iron-containing alcohol dehydrogenase [Clostridium sp. SHJSY1]
MAIYYVPSINIMGAGCLKELTAAVKDFGFKKALIVTDKFLVKSGIAKKVEDVLIEAGVISTIYDEVIPNPTCRIVNDGLVVLNEEKCDFIVSIGGGSPQDTAKAIGILATNGGDIKSYEGVNLTKNKSLPIVAVNTTAGTSSEVTINYVITDEERKVKMVIVDKNSMATITVNDPELMINKPAALTAATGMDALTHAIETIVTPGAYPVTDATALNAVKIIFEYLPKAVRNGHDIEAREQMVYAIFLAGVAFSNAGLGNVHAMAHQLGGVYNLPHGVCNAMLLPYVEEENAKFVPEKFVSIAKILNCNIEGKSAEECATFVIDKIKELSKEVGIPETLGELGVTDINFDLLADNAAKDICAPGNPVEFSKDKIIELFKKIV